MRVPWHLATLLICALHLILVNFSSVSAFLFRRKNVHHVVTDPFQVKKQNITRDNLLAWVNLENHVKFRLWTRKNPKWAHEIRVGEMHTVRSSNFDPRRLTKIIVHGYAHSANEIYLEDWIVELRDAYLFLADVNVVVIDYTFFALPAFYWTAASDLAARRLTAFIKFMLENKQISLEGLHVLGFSWGAHIAGIAGYQLEGKIARITGLDPAQPTFRLVDDTRRLDKTDAVFVDIIHTNSGRPFMEGHLGLGNSLGHADYYPNSGRAQPGCPVTWTYAYEEIECDHARSVNFYSESIVSPLAFPSCPCDDWDHYVKGECTCDPETTVYMGEHAPHTTRGKFYLFTRDKKPFGLGSQMNISLPDIDQYDPDFNNTGYHNHLRPYLLKTEPGVFGGSGGYKDNSAVLQTSPYLLLTPVRNTLNSVAVEPSLESQSGDVIKVEPIREYSYSYVDNNLVAPSGHFRIHSRVDSSTTSANANGTELRFKKEANWLPQKQAEPQYKRFSTQLFAKYLNGTNRYNLQVKVPLIKNVTLIQ